MTNNHIQEPRHFKIMQTLLHFFISVNSFLLMIFYLDIRISKKQLSIALIPEEIQKYYGVFLYFFFTSCLILVILLLRIYLKKRKVNKDKEKTGIFGKFFLKLETMFSPLTFFYKLYSRVFHWISPRYMKYVVFYASNILEYSKFKNKCIIISAVILPRAVIVCILIFEIYLKTLHYYFFSLFLLLIPLIFRFVLFVYSDIAKQVLPKLNEFVERVPNTKNVTLTLDGKTETFGTIGYRFTEEFANSPDGKNTDLDHFMMLFYNPMLFIDPHMEVYILPVYNKYTNITLYIYISIQIICWAYIIFLI